MKFAWKEIRGKLNCQYLPNNSSVLYNPVQFAQIHITGQLILTILVFFPYHYYISQKEIKTFQGCDPRGKITRSKND